MALDTAVIPCGGLARRLRPVSYWVPKEMLPVGLKPLLYWALDEVADPTCLSRTRRRDLVCAGSARWIAPFVVVQPDHLFAGVNGAALVAAAYRSSGRSAALLAEVSSDSAASTGALGRATVEGLDHGVGRVTNLTARGPSQERFDLAGAPRQLAPFGRVAYPASVFSEFEIVRAGVPEGW